MSHPHSSDCFTFSQAMRSMAFTAFLVIHPMGILLREHCRLRSQSLLPVFADSLPRRLSIEISAFRFWSQR